MNIHTTPGASHPSSKWSQEDWNRIVQRDGYSREFIRQAKETRQRRLKEEMRKLARETLRARSVPLPIIDMVCEVAENHGVCPAAIVSQSRSRKVVAARAEALYRARAHVSPAGRSPSFPQIGRWFGTDHTTVIFAIASHQERTGAPTLTTYNIGWARRRSAAREQYRRERDRGQDEA